MDITQFIKKTLQVLQDDTQFVVVFQAATYPHTFFMQYMQQIKQELSDQLICLDMQSGDVAFKAQLATSFLGMSCVYWLGDVTSLKAKQKEELLGYLATYQGPHKIIFFVDAKTTLGKSKSMQVITLQDKYFYQDAKALLSAQDAQQMHKTAMFLHEIYKIKNSFTLDELSLLQNYQDFITHDMKKFCQSWATRLVIPETSLFTLSQLFFEKKEEAFFRLWLSMKDLYSEMFWVAFWSDQLYRAYFFIAFTQRDNFLAAKQTSFGLPFSFMKQSYKLYQPYELHRAHQAMYAIDTALKHGAHPYIIDQWYVHFFVGKFKK